MIQILIRHRDQILMISIAIVYMWFGALKFFPGASPAEALAKETLDRLTWGLIPVHLSYFLLALWEVLIGALILFGRFRQLAIGLALVHLLLTFVPLVLLPSVSFRDHVYELTLVGQYIIKNLMLFSALLFLFPLQEKVEL